MNLRDWPVAVIAALLLTSASASAQAEPVAPSAGAADTLLLRTAAAIVAKRDELARVWPGFWPGDDSFVLAVPGETVLVVSRGTPGSEYVRLPGLPEYPALEGIAYLWIAREALSTVSEGWWATWFRTGDVNATAIALRETEKASVEVLLHEAFHRYQFDHLRGVLGRNVEDAPAFSDIDFNVLAELERQILASALQAPDTEVAVSVLREYVTIRVLREQSFPRPVEAERSVELMEGTAHYVGVRSAGIVTGEGRQAEEEVRYALQEPLRLQESVRFVNRPDPVMFDDPNVKMRWTHRSRLYATGAAIALLLDRLGVSWQEDAGTGRSFPDLITEAISLNPTVDLGTPEDILRRYGAEAIRARVDILLRAAAATP